MGFLQVEKERFSFFSLHVNISDIGMHFLVDVAIECIGSFAFPEKSLIN